MKKFIFFLAFFVCVKINAQNKKASSSLEFESCQSLANSYKCSEEIIINRILDASKSDIKKFISEHPECNNEFALHVSFVVSEEGKPIPQSIRTTKNKSTNIEQTLKNIVLGLPKITPKTNEYNYKVLFYYSLFIDVALKENDKLILLNKTNEPKELSDNPCCKSPIYKGCEVEKSNEALKKCFSKNVSKIIGRKFNSNKAFKKFNKKGTFYSYILFKIGEEGEVTQINAFSPNKNISDEAIRSLGKIKRLEPGTKNGEPVSVPFVLPIKFKL